LLEKYKSVGGFMKSIVLISTFFVTILVLSTPAFAARGGGGGHSFGVTLGFSSPSQDDMNAIVTEVNSAGGSADKLGTGYVYGAFYEYRISGTIFGLHFRPQIFSQTAAGTSYDSKLTGFSFFPILKFYPLENSFIHFFMQVGLGYGQLNGEQGGGGNSVTFSGSAFGALGGLGAEFCFVPAHCLMVEGNIKYLPIERNQVDSVTGTPAGYDTVVNGQELENNNRDVGTTMSGIEGVLAYKMNF
jgi:hypothetical protein